MARKKKGNDDGSSPLNDQGLSLDELSGSLANLMNGGASPYEDEAGEVTEAPVKNDDSSDAEEGSGTTTGTSDSNLSRKGTAIRPSDVDDPCPVTPETIFEAMLFVGHPGDEPLTSTQVASLMRGVRANEVDQYVEDLNATYAEQNCPYEIQSVGGGYRLVLRDSFSTLRSAFYGKVRTAKLSQAAVDVLAIVAYHQPLDKNEVEEMRREPSARLLNQLVRRELLRVERTEEKPRRSLFSTTERFLDFFDLTSLDDLPQSQDFDRR